MISSWSDVLELVGRIEIERKISKKIEIAGVNRAKNTVGIETRPIVLIIKIKNAEIDTPIGKPIPIKPNNDSAHFLVRNCQITAPVIV